MREISVAKPPKPRWEANKEESLSSEDPTQLRRMVPSRPNTVILSFTFFLSNRTWFWACQLPAPYGPPVPNNAEEFHRKRQCESDRDSLHLH